METPSIGWLLVPVLVWVACGVAVLIVHRRNGTSRLLLRLAAAFLALWALLATTALVWLVANGGWPALASLAQHPPPIFESSALSLWTIGALGAFGVLSAIFFLNQVVARGILAVSRLQPLAWPSTLAARASGTELYLFVSPSATAFSFTLVDRATGRWRRREVVLVSDTLWAALEPAEREAVVAHELAHVLDLDSRYLTFLRTFANVMRWDPVLGYLAGRLTHREEFRADDDAVETTHHPLALARALFKAITLAENSPPSARVSFLGVGGRRGRREALERIQRLVALAESGPPTGEARG